MTCNRCGAAMICSVNTGTEIGFICQPCGNFGILRKELDKESGSWITTVDFGGIQIREDSNHPLLLKLWDAVSNFRKQKQKKQKQQKKIDKTDQL
jgi:hypothetical protein